MNERKPKNWLAVLVVLQCVTLAAIYGLGPSISAVRAQGIPDAGAQQQAIIEQLKDVNAKLDRITAILSGGIEVKQPKQAGEPAGR